MSAIASSGELTGLPNVLDLIPERWRDAACVGEDPELFFFEGSFAEYRPLLSSASLLLPMLICTGCTVRRECLLTALEPPRTGSGDHEKHVYGVWGGSSEYDRHTVRELPTAAAIDVLEATRPDRVAQRAAGWREGFDARKRTGHGITQRDRRIEAILDGGPSLQDDEREAPDPTPVTALPARSCRECSEVLPKGRRDMKYCSGRCRVRALRGRRAA